VAKIAREMGATVIKIKKTGVAHRRWEISNACKNRSQTSLQHDEPIAGNSRKLEGRNAQQNRLKRKKAVVRAAYATLNHSKITSLAQKC